MNNYKVIVELLTETIFGSGYSVPGSVDLEIVCDEYGFPFMKAKTFKGNLREKIEETVNILGDNYKHIVENLLGEENQAEEINKNLKFSDCKLRENIRKKLEYAIKKGQIEPHEIKEALTNTRIFTSIDENGVAKDGSLRQIRVIKKGLYFEVNISCERKLEEVELGVLAISLRTLKHLGTMRTRGKGEVDCKLYILEDDVYKDKTNFYIEKLVERGDI